MFNHEARWDRKLPVSHTSELGAPISVNCQIQNGRILPKSFEWKGDILPIQKINFFWKDKQGSDVLHFFSVKTEKGAYQIVFSIPSLNWHLNKLLGP